MFKERDQLFVRFRIAEYPIKRHQVGIEVVVNLKGSPMRYDPIPDDKPKWNS